MVKQNKTSKEVSKDWENLKVIFYYSPNDYSFTVCRIMDNDNNC